MLSKILRIAATVWLIGVVIVVMASYASILYYQGIWKFWEVVSPYNIWNYGLTLVVASPGFFLLWLSEKLSKGKHGED